MTLLSIAAVTTSASAEPRQIANASKKPCMLACADWATNHSHAGVLTSWSAAPGGGACNCNWALPVSQPGTYEDFFGCWWSTGLLDLDSPDVFKTCYAPVYGDAEPSVDAQEQLQAIVAQAQTDEASLFSIYDEQLRAVIATQGDAGKQILSRWSEFYGWWSASELTEPSSSLYGVCWSSVYGDLELPSADAEQKIADIVGQLGADLADLGASYEETCAPIFEDLGAK